jgi:hypothetical protein
MSKFTPGPWEVEFMADRDGDWFSIEAPMVGRSGTVADTYNRDHVIEADEDRANARLMAAAPDLLEACMAMVATFHDHLDRDESSLAMAREAIAKAIGEAT